MKNKLSAIILALTMLMTPLVSFAATAEARERGVNRERMDMAALGPIPDTLMRSRYIFSSSRV